jgi:hypothetical protein
MSNDAMIRKIAAILAKANGTDNEHEAEAFHEAAKKLMEKHGLKEDDLDTDKLGHANADFTISADLIWKSQLVWATAKYFGCQAVRDRQYKVVYFNLVGREGARATVSVMFPYILSEVRKKANDMIQINGKSLSSNTRDLGLALAARLFAEAEESEDALTKYMDEKLEVEFSKSNLNYTGLAQRMAASISLHKQTGNTKVKTLAHAAA